MGIAEVERPEVLDECHVGRAGQIDGQYDGFCVAWEKYLGIGSGCMLA